MFNEGVLVGLFEHFSEIFLTNMKHSVDSASLRISGDRNKAQTTQMPRAVSLAHN